ncbi:MAG: hypothetical protein EAZ44_08815 [Cytophagia bacterium]|nr:MAG: hypothetical protein EAZ44_08815 [Cytophagia bacterium]TAG38776.1 MAG: hypothetical protein EAZ31_10090 [Cytophagia bacterium]TAH28096.1 MAG: hypothetical protein EAZ06_11305 [Cytophagales bacterium]
MAQKGSISPEEILKQIENLVSLIPEDLLKKQKSKKEEKKKEENTDLPIPKILSEKNEVGKVLAHALPVAQSKGELQKPQESNLASFKSQEWNLILQSVKYFAYYIEEKNGLKAAMPIFDLVDKIEKIVTQITKK